MLARFAALAAFAVLALVASLWAWRVAGPSTPPLQEPALPSWLARLALYPPFGTAAPAATPASAVSARATDPRLLGVFSERDGAGRALFRMPDGTPRLAAAGTALTGDLHLVAVLPDRVTVRDGSGERAIALWGPPAQETSAGKRVAAGPPGLQACGVPASYKGPIVRLAGELVAGLIAQPDSLRKLAESRDGALVIREEAGFASLVGMKKGDRVVEANGIALRTPDDIVLSVLRPLAARQAVRLKGTRGGDARELYIVNVSGCA